MDQKQSNDNTDVGIVSVQSYFPKLFISQNEFEQFNNVSTGKYTIGLGQNEMAFTTDREDICSISLTVLSNLLKKNDVKYSDIGWVCVATETIIDHSKSISSMLMNEFHQNGNTQIEGIDVKHACYAGTFALFSAFDRISSKYWDGKYCIVIAADIAEYESGPARCTGGCGAVALLLGKNACIDLNITRASYKAHQYDFYKPNLNSPYPVVNGAVSNNCYMSAFDACITSYKKKCGADWRPIEHETAPDYWIFHAPYNKLVCKTFGRVIYHDFISNPTMYYTKFKDDEKMTQFLKKYEKVPYKDAMTREVIKGFEKISKSYYKKYVGKSAFLPKSIGNCYTASIFMGLVSLIDQCRNDFSALEGKTIQIFSYGSGTMASMYLLQVNKGTDAVQQLKQIANNNDVVNRLQQRVKVPCNVFTDIMDKKVAAFHKNEMENDFAPKSAVNDGYFYENTYYLSKMDVKKQRFYDCFASEKLISKDVNRDNEGDVEKKQGKKTSRATEKMEKVKKLLAIPLTVSVKSMATVEQAGASCNQLV